MCDISFHVGIVCSLDVSHGGARTLSQSLCSLCWMVLCRHLLGLHRTYLVSLRVLLPCLVVNAALCRLSCSKLPFLPIFMIVSRRQIVQLFGCGIGPLSSAHCVHSFEPILVRLSCCCFPALFAMSVFVTCGEHWSASDRAWTFFHSFPRSACSLGSRPVSWGSSSEAPWSVSVVRSVRGPLW